jgi:AcrR family transcriptional regulator
METMNDSSSPSKAAAARGGDTRAQLLESAVRLFAIHGYDGVTTRRLAADAGVNVAAIAYHFGGKRELYRAVLSAIVGETEAMFGPAVAAISNGVTAAKGNKAALARFATLLVGNFIRGFIEYDAMRWRASLVLKEYAQPSEDFDILYRGRIEPLHRAVTELAAAALGLDPEDPRAAMRAHTVMGQIVVFGIARVVLLKRLDWDELTPDRLTTAIEVATDSVLASLDLPRTGKTGNTP